MKNSRQRVHFVHPYLMNPTNPITVALIGAGGTGSQMLTALARINHALQSLGHAGLQVSVYDDDTVQLPNLGRQLFSQSELGLNKGIALINRINRFFGTNWKGIPQRFETETSSPNEERNANIVLSCVDSVSSRMAIEKLILSAKTYHRDSFMYLLDFGNSRDSGQVFLSTIQDIEQPTSKKYLPVASMPSMLSEYENLLLSSEQTEDMPSCSLAEALTKQDLFINSCMANMGASLLWSMFRVGVLFNRGFFFNLADFRSQPVAV